MSSSVGITNIYNMAPELPLQVSENVLSTPMFNLIHSIGAFEEFAQENLGRNYRMFRYERLSTEGGQLDGSGLDPAPEIPIRTDVDTEVEVFAKTIAVTEQVVLFENPKVMTRFEMLLGQWLREKEDLLMRDLYSSSISYVNCVGGINGQQPSEITAADVTNIERILLGNDARTIIGSFDATRNIATSGLMDSFVAMVSTDIIPDLRNIQGVILKNAYPNQEGLRPEEYCSVGRFRFFVTSKGAKIPGISQPGGQTVYTIPMMGVEAASKIAQNGYTTKVGFRPDWVVSSVAQNSQLYCKFAIARAMANTNWASGLKATQSI